MKKDGVGWPKCCPPTGNKADIVKAVRAAQSGGAGQPAPPRATNINGIAKGSSQRLAHALSAGMADDILHEKEVGGEFKDFTDLERRVSGIGPAKVKNMRNAGFFVSPTKRAIVDGAHAEDEVRLEDLRGDVKSLDGTVWRYRNNKDLYTGLSKAKVVELQPEVDHVWECQLVNYANQRAAQALTDAGRRLAAHTRGAQSSLKKMVNSRVNLNVTTHEVNQAKKGPFSQWLHRRQKGESLILEDVHLPRRLVDSGTWARVERSVVNTYKDLEEAAGDHAYSQAVLEEMNVMLDAMRID